MGRVSSDEDGDDEDDEDDTDDTHNTSNDDNNGDDDNDNDDDMKDFIVDDVESTPALADTSPPVNMGAIYRYYHSSFA